MGWLVLAECRFHPNYLSPQRGTVGVNDVADLDIGHWVLLRFAPGL
jgi:hypothetical protein